MSLVYPIFNDDPIFGKKMKKTSCPAKSDICGNLPGISVLDSFVIPKCNDTNFKFSLSKDDSPSGCCVVESSNNTCDTYIPDSPNFTSDDYDTGIQFLDADKLNPRKIEIGINVLLAYDSSNSHPTQAQNQLYLKNSCKALKVCMRSY